MTSQSPPRPGTCWARCGVCTSACARSRMCCVRACVRVARVHGRVGAKSGLRVGACAPVRPSTCAHPQLSPGHVPSACQANPHIACCQFLCTRTRRMPRPVTYAPGMLRPVTTAPTACAAAGHNAHSICRGRSQQRRTRCKCHVLPACPRGMHLLEHCALYAPASMHVCGCACVPVCGCLCVCECVCLRMR